MSYLGSSDGVVGSDLFFQFSTCFPHGSEMTKAGACADPKDQTSTGRNNIHYPQVWIRTGVVNGFWSELCQQISRDTVKNFASGTQQ